jgi:hypothetical protein
MTIALDFLLIAVAGALPLADAMAPLETRRHDAERWCG